MSNGVIFLLLVLVVIINAAISFAIANRFYKLSKKTPNLQSELRALRRDIDEKFSGSVKEVKESAAEVKNSNENLSRDGGFKKEAKAPSADYSEIAKRWNIEIERDEEPEIKIKASDKSKTKREKKFKPQREKRVTVEADEGVGDSVKNKAKEILGDIFPFGDEE